jgi:putative PEP-CTERM system histidine kinase
MSLEQVLVLSVAIGLIAYSALSVFFIVGWGRRITGRAALIAAVTTSLWFAVWLAVGLQPITEILEVACYAAWIGLLLRVLGLSTSTALDAQFRLQLGFATLTALSGLTAAALLALQPTDAPPLRFVAFSKLGLCVIGLILVEQVIRNTRRNHQWSLKFVGIGLATLFGYGFLLHVDASLFNAPRASMLALQGLVYAFATPLLAIASLRNRNAPLSVNLSREFVFRSGMLIATGAYLLLMGAAGYYLQVFGGDWGGVLQVLLSSAAVLTVVVLLFSAQFRSKVREFVTRNLYEQKYDYRDQWMRVTRELAARDADSTLGDAAIHALAGTIQSDGGRIWRLTDEGTLVPLPSGSVLQAPPLSPAATPPLIDYFATHDWIVDLAEYRRDASQYPGLSFDHDLEALRGARLLVPLFVDEKLFALAALGGPSVPFEMSWEDFNILKVIGRQVAGYLALQHADQVLSESKQLRAMNQVSAFIVHDLKTVTAQLSLMLRNAEKHSGNPEFVADMVRTTDNAVARMNRLLAQLKDAKQDSGRNELDLVEVTREALASCGNGQAALRFDAPSHAVRVAANRDRLAAAIGHIVKNAQEATAETGDVKLCIREDGDWVALEITDSGSGMTEDFMRRELFTPFATTKGLSGMGIGTYQAREYVRSVGGDVSVTSRLGHGTSFTLRLPAGAIALRRTP